MLKFQWNALRHGHHVRVHDPASPAMALLAGTVVTIDSAIGRGRANGVGIRVEDGDGTHRVVRPTYLAVHLEPLDPAEPCWRCAEIAALAPVAAAGATAQQAS